MSVNQKELQQELTLESTPSSETVEVLVEEPDNSLQVVDQPETEDQVVEQPETDDELEQYSEGVKKRINKLTYKAKEAERREKAALDYAQSMKVQNEALNNNQTQVDGSYLEEMESRINFQEENLKSALQKAIETGDIEEQIKINKDLAKHALDSERLAYAKNQRETQLQPQPQQGLPQQQVQQPQQPQQQQPVSPKANAWANRAENSWFGNDEVMTLAAFSLHNGLAAEGWQVDADDYWQELDNRLRGYFPGRFNTQSSQPTAKRPSSVAPANRVKTNSKGKKSIKLTDSEAAIAEKLGVTNDQYAKEVLKIQINKT